MPDEDGFATPEERGDFHDPDAEATAAAAADDTAVDDSDDGDTAGAAEGGGDGGGDDDNAAAAADAADDTEATGDVSADAEGGDEAAGEPAATEGDEDVAAPPGYLQIPKPRFDEKIRQLRAAQDRIRELEEAAAAAQAEGTETALQQLTTALDQKNEEIANALKDGDAKNITTLLAEQQNIQAQLTQAQINMSTAAATRQSTAQQEFLAARAEVESVHPFLDPRHADYDQEKVDAVSELVQDFQRAGKSATDALYRAVNLLHPKPTHEVQPKTKGVAAQQKAQPKGKRKTDVAKNVAAAKQQPPNLADVGDDADKLGITKTIDVTKLSEEEFDALPKETLRRLRGDYL